jgi:hypothetical protein
LQKVRVVPHALMMTQPGQRNAPRMGNCRRPGRCVPMRPSRCA